MSSTTPAKGRILLGEDVRLISYRMRQTLEQAGYAVLKPATVRSACESRGNCARIW
jgi:hypothetical protein